VILFLSEAADLFTPCDQSTVDLALAARQLFFEFVLILLVLYHPARLVLVLGAARTVRRANLQVLHVLCTA